MTYQQLLEACDETFTPAALADSPFMVHALGGTPGASRGEDIEVAA